MSNAEQGRMLASATFGTALGVVVTAFGSGRYGGAIMIAIAALLALCLAGLMYSGKTERCEFLDTYVDCGGNCKGQFRRRELWRLPSKLREMRGVPVCATCFYKITGNHPFPLLGDTLAHAKKGEEHENTREGKREHKQREKNGRRFQEVLEVPVTEEGLRANLIDPLGRQRPEVRQALEKLIKETAANQRSPQSPKRGP
jgi:hypothetical protein